MKSFVYKTEKKTVFVQEITISAEKALDEIKELFEKYNKRSYYEGKVSINNPKASIVRMMEPDEFKAITPPLLFFMPLNSNKERIGVAEKAFDEFVLKRLKQDFHDYIASGKSIEDYLKILKKTNPLLCEELKEVYFGYVVSTFDFETDMENPSIYFVFKEDNILNNKLLADKFEESERKFTESFKEIFKDWFELFVSAIKDLSEKKFYKLYIYDNESNGEDKPKIEYQNMFDVNIGPYQESIFDEDLPDGIEDFDAFVKEYMKNH